MTTLAGADLAALVVGAAECGPGRSGGISPRRLPTVTDAQHRDPMLTWLACTPAGARLRMVTTGTEVRLRLRTSTVQIAGGAPPRPPVLTAIAGDVRTTAALPLGEVLELDEDLRPVGRRSGEDAQVRIDARPAAGGPIELWLPHDRVVDLHRLSSDGDLTPAPDPAPRWLHYGSSISHGLEAPAPDLTWPAQVARSQGWQLDNFSFAGNAMLDIFVAEQIAAVDAELITIKAGINIVGSDAMRERVLRPLWHGFLDTVRRSHPTTPVVLITAIACPAVESRPGPIVTVAGQAAAASRRIDQDAGALTLERTRQVAREVVADREDENLYLLEGTDLFGASDADRLYDGLHPDPVGMTLIADRFPAALAAVLPTGRWPGRTSR